MPSPLNYRSSTVLVSEHDTAAIRLFPAKHRADFFSAACHVNLSANQTCMGDTVHFLQVAYQLGVRPLLIATAAHGAFVFLPTTSHM